MLAVPVPPNDDTVTAGVVKKPRRPSAAATASLAPGPLDLLEDAVHLLRRAPAATLACYYLGSLPFVLGLLFVCADLSRDPAAAEAPGLAAAWLSALFLCMLTGQGIFAARLRAQLGPQSVRPAPWTPRRVARLALVQAVWQPSKLFVIPFSLVLFGAPLGWALAFYGHVNALADAAHGSPGRAAERATRGALLWPAQNHAALGVLMFLTLFVWLNVFIACLLLPQLLKTFSGADNVFTRAGFSLLNSTFFAVTFALVYLLVDPLWKTFCVLRCFHADARRTGEDLQAALEALPVVPVGGATTAADKARLPSATPAATTTLAAGVILFCSGLFLLTHPPGVFAASSASPSPTRATASPGVPPADLDRSIEDVLNRREFAWKLPRERVSQPDNAASETSYLRRFLRWLNDSLGRLARWLRKLFARSENSDSDPPSIGFSLLALKPLALLAGGLLLLLTLFLIAKTLLARQRARAGRAAQDGTDGAASGTPAIETLLADEGLLASSLPEDDWLRLARELLAKGEARLALRAFYLSTLALLAGRGLVGISRLKSNGDYLHEVRRRARDRDPALPTAFARAVRGFERAWYGRHPADEAAVAALLADRQTIADTAPPPPATLASAAAGLPPA